MIGVLSAARSPRSREASFRSLQEQIDTTTSGGKLVFHVFGALGIDEQEIKHPLALVEGSTENATIFTVDTARSGHRVVIQKITR